MTRSAADPSRVAVVLAGGESRRFGSDKLVADLGGRTLLAAVVDGLPSDLAVIVVGPERPLPREVSYVREDPPGGGPAAGLVAGLKAALGTPAESIWVLPGDAPDAGGAAGGLAAALDAGTGRAVVAVVGVDAEDRLQPLQLALRRSAAEQLIRLAGPAAGHAASVRRLVLGLTPAALHRRISPAGHFDIDTVSDLRHYQHHDLRNDGRT